MYKKLREKLRTLKSEGGTNLKIQKGDIVKYEEGEKIVVFKGEH